MQYAFTMWLLTHGKKLFNEKELLKINQLAQRLYCRHALEFPLYLLAKEIREKETNAKEETKEAKLEECKKKGKEFSEWTEGKQEPLHPLPLKEPLEGHYYAENAENKLTLLYYEAYQMENPSDCMLGDKDNDAIATREQPVKEELVAEMKKGPEHFRKFVQAEMKELEKGKKKE